MKRNWWTRFTLLLFFTCLSIAALVPTVFDYDEKDSSYFIKSKINLGLDLQGGLYMVLGIDFKKVYKDEAIGYARKIVAVLKDYDMNAQMGELDKSDPADPKHSVILDSNVNVDEAMGKIKSAFPGYLRLTKQEGELLQFGISNVLKTKIEEQAVTKSIEVIRNRIDEFGVTEPEVISQGNDRIIVALPGVKDIERAKQLIGKTAKLQFKIVNDKVFPAQLQTFVNKGEAAGITYAKGERFSKYLDRLNDHLVKDLPGGYEIAFQKTYSKLNNELESKIPFLVEKASKLSGEDLQDAEVRFNQDGLPYVSLTFKSGGAKRFEEITGENIGRRLAIVLDGNVYSAPNIRSRIPGGSAQIELGTGNVNKILKEARELAMVLRAGALPVQLDFLEQRTVGPSLGKDSIEKARYASMIGCIFVFIFVLFYYRVSGAIALTCLSLNVIFVLACLVGLEATLTLPGIAGIALTIGMAVDANIIIYERIREEIRKGVSNYKAAENGFGHAFWTLLDANITTALAGLCLLNFGTGPIRGFAVTLLIGIGATVYTSYFVGKLLFELYMDKVEGQDLSI